MSKKRNNTIEEIDLLELAKAVWKKIIVIILLGVLCGTAAFGYTKLFIPPRYSASILLYVNNSSVGVGATSVRISTGELNAAQSLIDTYGVILKSRATLDSVIAKSGCRYSYNQLKGMVSSAGVNDTEIFRVSVTSTDPEEARDLANCVADVLPDVIAGIVDNSSVRVLDYAVTPQGRVSPSYSNNAIKGVLFGVVLGCAYACLCFFLDDVIHNEDYLQNSYNIPMLSSIPDLYTKTSSSYSYGKKK